MTISERQQNIFALIGKRPDITVRELAETFFVSEPTIRRDLTELERRGMVTKCYGGAKLLSGATDGEIPFLLREKERSAAKVEMGRKAAAFVGDGMVLMLDGSTSAYYMVPYLAAYKDLIVVTSGARTAVTLGEHGIKVFSTGGQMMPHSFSYIGEAAENFVRNFNADICFFSCRGVSDDGVMSDVSIEEMILRKAMMGQSKKKVLLCDRNKFGKKYLYNLGNIDELDAVVSNTDEKNAGIASAE